MNGSSSWRTSWLLFALNWCLHAPGQQPETFGALHRDDFSGDAGVHGSNVLQLRCDARGVLWAATSNGLLRYDGYEWRRYGIEHGLPSRLVRTICPARNGELWVGTDAGAGVFDGASFDRRDAAEELRGRSVRRIVEDPEGALWFCCDHWPNAEARGGLLVRRAGGWRRYGAGDGLPSEYVSDFVITGAGRRFVLTGHGLAEMHSDRFTQPLVAAGLARARDYIWSLVEDRAGDLFATGPGVMFQHTGGSWRQLDVQVPGAHGAETPIKLWRLADGTLASYISNVEDRVVRWNGRGFDPWSEPLAGSGVLVEDMIEGPDRALWIGGVRLLTRWQPHDPEWSLWPLLRAPQFVDTTARLWFTTATGSAFLTGGGPVEAVDLSGPLASCRDGVLGQVGEGLGFWRDGKVHRIDPAALGLARIGQWLAGPSGEAWVAGVDAEGLHTIRRQFGDGWRSIVGLPPGFAVTSMALAAGDTMTAILRRGNDVVASLFRAERLELLRLPATPPTTPSPQVFLDGDDTWLIGAHRLRRLRADGSWALVDGLPGDTVCAAFRSAAELWFACEGTLGGAAGLVRYDGRSIQPSNLPGTQLIGVGPPHYLGDAGATLTVFPADAPPHVVALPIPERAGRAVRDASGAVWIQTSRGSLRWSPDGVPPKTVARFNSAGIGERDVAMLTVDVRRNMRPRHRNGRLQASYRIDGGDWSPFEGVDARIIQLGSLPVGSHTVEVVVRDEAGVADPRPVAVPVEVFPIPLQQRWWFWGLVALALGCLGLFAGATNRSKALSRALRERLDAERRYRVVVENSPLGILELDGAGKIMSINEAGATMLFVASGEAIGAALSDFVEPAGRELIEKIVGRDGASFEFTTMNGRQIEATLRSMAEPDGSSARFALNLKDVTESRHLEASARHSQRMEAIGRLAGGVAHDFNNLLTAVLGNVELLRQQLSGVQPVHAAAHALLGEVELAGRRAAELTRQLLTFARRGQSSPMIVDVKSALRQMQSLLGRIVSAEVQLYIDDEQAPATVRLGPGQFEQIVLNLVTNAAEAMDNRGAVKIRLWHAHLDLPDAARFGMLAAGTYVVVAVADHGPGIAREVLQHLFEPFFTTKFAGKGTGLGLATVHGIVHAAGGRVDVSTQVGVGSEFVVWLPLVDDAPPVGTASAPATVGGGETVLVCDDQPLVRATVVNMLQGLGYHVLAAANADEALRIASAHQGAIDLLLTDVTMPERTGPELASVFAESRRDTRVLFMTGFDATDLELPKSVLTKPFSREQLAAHIRAALA